MIQRVRRRAMGATAIEYGLVASPPLPPPVKVSPRTRYQRYLPPRARARAMGSLGDDTLAASGTTASTADSTAQFQTQMLASQQDLFTLAKTTSSTLTTQRWLQIAATLSIPLAGLVWKWILGRRTSTL